MREGRGTRLARTQTTASHTRRTNPHSICMPPPSSISGSAPASHGTSPSSLRSISTSSHGTSPSSLRSIFNQQPWYLTLLPSILLHNSLLPHKSRQHLNPCCDMLLATDNMSNHRLLIASSPGHSQILSCSREEKSVQPMYLSPKQVTQQAVMHWQVKRKGDRNLNCGYNIICLYTKILCKCKAAIVMVRTER